MRRLNSVLGSIGVALSPSCIGVGSVLTPGEPCRGTSSIFAQFAIMPIGTQRRLEPSPADNADRLAGCRTPGYLRSRLKGIGAAHAARRSGAYPDDPTALDARRSSVQCAGPATATLMPR